MICIPPNRWLQSALKTAQSCKSESSKDICKNPHSHVALRPTRDGDLSEWDVFVRGPPDSLYEGGSRLPLLSSPVLSCPLLSSCRSADPLFFFHSKKGGIFRLSAQIPPSYPIAPPKFRMITKICHPNIHYKVPFGVRSHTHPHTQQNRNSHSILKKKKKRLAKSAWTFSHPNGVRRGRWKAPVWRSRSSWPSLMSPVR